MMPMKVKLSLLWYIYIVYLCCNCCFIIVFIADWLTWVVLGKRTLKGLLWFSYFYGFLCWLKPQSAYGISISVLYCMTVSKLYTFSRFLVSALNAFSAFMPSVQWRCWLGSRKGIRPVKNWVVRCWRGYLSGARCRLAYGPADSTATHCLLLR